ncbi:TolC family protein [Lutimonas zeaxanthinifaciens]|uniref:TolC family protein n=1 Tax=Lutimonas zeaxanthinifaciens TaxID=3060215 RepID=UPI00265CD91B|nr:TolC family protein [Lutimonas sp. YSD2104]WKK67261.1 TolC family protein [Lutimonas sp. YSD2104]
MKINKVLSLLVLLLGFSMNAQGLLEKQGAVDIALENNYDIKVSNNDLEAAKNSSSIYNSGYLPSVFANGGADYQSNESEIEFQNGTVQDDIENTTNSVNASVGIDYLLFDGFGRKYNYKKLQEQYNISEIRVRQVIENTLLDLLIAYYDVALLTENKSNLEQSLAISKSQLLREQYGYQYGQKTQLDVLNSEVNVNQDSINLLNIQRELANAKRDLNVILGRNVNIDFQVDTTVTYALDLTYDNMMQSAKLNNTLLLQAEKNVTLSDYDLKINKSSWVPNVGINGAYNWRDSNTESNNSNPFLLASQTSRGIVGGLTVSWNIFDGGQTKTRVQNAKIAIDNSNIEKELVEKDLERNVANAWETYQNSLFVLNAEEKNVETNRQNFLRSEEQFKLGQIITVEFRLAQVNFLSAINSYNQAKYTAKVAELRLLQLGGKLIGANY